jgi:UDP-N-acetylglucosamine--N-acetylmuramyl-(pentapeptide) pyrophosphoryl-undecaprenol N-acetylglucosamine transferase
MALVNNGAALIIEEKDLTPDKLTETVNSLLADREKLSQLGKNARDMAVIDATERIYNTLCGLIDGK